MCTVVGLKTTRPGIDFFPLTVNYQEKTYAAGKIPGGFFRREGRPSEKETLTCRLIDRPIRPLFPKGFKNEVEVICTVMSADKDMDPDIASLIGTSAALAVSGLPFNGPIGAARVGYKDGQYLLNPGYAALKDSRLNMVVAGTESAVLMVESEAQELTEDQMLGGVLFGHDAMQIAITAIKELAAEAGKPRWEVAGGRRKNEALITAVGDLVKADLGAAYRTTDKQERQTRDQCAARAMRVAELARRRCAAVRAGRCRRCVRQAREAARSPARAERRTADRRPRSAQGAPDRDRSRRAAEGTRIGAVHAR